MNKEHTIQNCWCKNYLDDEERKSVMAEMMKDNKREESLNGYRATDFKGGKEKIIKSYEAPF